MKLSLVKLKEQAEQLRAAREHLSAIRIYIAILQRNPGDYITRQHLGEALERVEAGPEAARVHEAVCKLCISNGRPLVAIVASRAMEALGKRPDTYLLNIASLYSKDARDRPGRPTRPTMPFDEPMVDARELRKECSVPELIAEAARVGVDLQGLDEDPPRQVTIPLLNEVSSVKLVSVIRSMLVHRLPAGHMVFRQGEPGQSCFLIAHGTVAVRLKKEDGQEAEVARLSDGAIFGEMSLITGTPRSATVQVFEETDLLEMGPESLAAIGDELPQVAAALDRLAQRRWMANLVGQSPVFSVFSEEERIALLKHFQAHEVPEGTAIITGGKALNGIYLVVRGEVVIKERGDDGTSRVTDHRGPGSTLGLRAVLAGAPAEISATTTTPATVLFMSASQLQRLVEAVPEFAQALRDSAPVL